VKLKYVKQSPICVIPNRMDGSHLGKDLMKIRHIYIKGREYKINNGRNISFWLDSWLDSKPLCVTYPILFDLCENQKISVHEAANEN
jgi:hypothetical protein